MSLKKSTTHNRLLGLLSDECFDAVAAQLEPVHLPRGLQVAVRGEPVEYYYFVESGMCSILAESPEGQKAEVGLVGRDGVFPFAAVLHSETAPNEVVVQLAGAGYRMPAASLLRLLGERPELQRLLLRFMQTLSAQAASTALSNVRHNAEERLARWLLMCHDRVDGDEIELTHDFIAIMLAVRRPTVTTTLHVLEGNRFIRSDRGRIIIRDRAALEAFAADAYGVAEDEYRRLIGPL